MKRYAFDGDPDEYGPYEDDTGRYVFHDDCAAALAAKDAKIAKLREQRDRLRAAVDSLRPGHYFCDHTSETCPRFQWGCTDDAKCTCGADETNAMLDRLLEEIGNG